MAGKFRVLLALLVLLAGPGAHPALGARLSRDMNTYFGELEVTDATTRAGSALHYPGLCAQEIVQETCLVLGWARGDEPDLAHAQVFPLHVQSAVAASASSVQEMWMELGLANLTFVTCTSLCQIVVGFLGERGQLPPASDVGCYTEDNGTLVCDIDLEPSRLSHRVGSNGKDLPNFKDRQSRQAESRQAAKARTALKTHGIAGLQERGDLKVKTHVREIDYTVYQLVVRVANLFRIFPALTTSVEEIEETDLDDSHDEADSANEAVQSKKHFCDKFTGRDPSECKEQPRCEWVAGKGCLKKRKSWSGSTSWKRDVKKRSVEAQAYVTTAIRKWTARETGEHMNKWFGPGAYSNPSTRAEVGRLLNAVARLIANVDYRFPGPECETNTYAYVFPHGDESLNKRGEYIFYLCPLYIGSPISEQIETLTHEGSHHATAYTDDVCMDEFYKEEEEINHMDKFVELPLSALPMGVQNDDTIDLTFENDTFEAYVHVVKKETAVVQLDPEWECDNVAYGRGDCEKLAQEKPKKALRNADSLCYYIQDITDIA